MIQADLCAVFRGDHDRADKLVVDLRRRNIGLYVSPVRAVGDVNICSIYCGSIVGCCKVSVVQYEITGRCFCQNIVGIRRLLCEGFISDQCLCGDVSMSCSRCCYGTVIRHFLASKSRYIAEVLCFDSPDHTLHLRAVRTACRAGAVIGCSGMIGAACKAVVAGLVGCRRNSVDIRDVCSVRTVEYAVGNVHENIAGVRIFKSSCYRRILIAVHYYCIDSGDQRVFRRIQRDLSVHDLRVGCICDSLCVSARAFCAGNSRPGILHAVDAGQLYALLVFRERSCHFTVKGALYFYARADCIVASCIERDRIGTGLQLFLIAVVERSIAVNVSCIASNRGAIIDCDLDLVVVEARCRTLAIEVCPPHSAGAGRSIGDHRPVKRVLIVIPYVTADRIIGIDDELTVAVLTGIAVGRGCDFY